MTAIGVTLLEDVNQEISIFRYCVVILAKRIFGFGWGESDSGVVGKDTEWTNEDSVGRNWSTHKVLFDQIGSQKD